MSIHKSIKLSLVNSLSEDSQNEINQLNDSLRLLCKWRSLLITNTYLQNCGVVIFQGPFKDMKFLNQSSEGCHMAKLFGTYEQPLHKYIEEIISTKYETIFNVGSAEGYYSVGLATRMQTTKILSFDINTAAQKACLELAKKNNVEASIEVFGEFHPELVNKYENKKCLIICDVEGEENQLLDISNYPALKKFDILVECHECFKPGMTKELLNRFASTHEISIINDNGQRHLDVQPEWFLQLSHLDQLLAVWEWRIGPTPWIFMKSLYN
tara:strand:- start:565 stop:1371 length:807 start_codon:yes stop_codon:yes gene_type:complete